MELQTPGDSLFHCLISLSILIFFAEEYLNDDTIL